jgi:endogenous inhibitor of DNA gyrase (YacG/DUF329 family)
MGQKAGCPICGRPVDPRHRPFCSRRCADVDLARWLRGTYVIPGAPPEEEEDETPAPVPDLPAGTPENDD